ncbi:lipopolysaccharide biosynthesis protein [Kineococcus indalonis]|uniref:lipopolysaccharide biosynthesis protein n=1 Tax=Kineococcus indalonis TaxID=2696566 RepID=UPI0014126024|nr:oligosaccharide flippase family protein [Kineococcus indalonis]NAZ87338.1 oligosaccharide flippase family protein [Kineococcus indalonis]
MTTGEVGAGRASARSAGPTGPAGPAGPAELAGTAGPADPAGAAAPSGLFGRSLLYAVVAAVQLATGALVAPVLAHVLDDPAQVGALAAAIALHQLLVVLALVGLDQAVVLQRAEDGHDRGARALAGGAVLVAAAVTALLWGTAAWWAPLFGFAPGTVAAPGIVATTVWWTVPAAGVMVTLGLLLAADRLRAYTVVSVLAAVGGQVAGLGAVLLLDGGAGTYAWGLLGADLLAALVGWRLARPRWRGALSPRVMRPALAFGAPLMLSSISVFLLNAGDRVVVQRLAGPAELGRYQVAYTVGFLAVQLIVVAGNSWLPRFAEVQDTALRRHLVGRTRDSVYRLLAPALLGVALAAPVALVVAAPASFRPRELLVVVVLVALSAYPVAAGTATGRVLVTERRTRALAACTALAAVLNIALNLLLVPVAGIAGSAAATAVAYAVQALAQRLALRARPGPWPRTPPRVLLEAAAVSALALALVVAPAGTAPDAARFALALACLPWCLRRLRRAKEGS